MTRPVDPLFQKRAKLLTDASEAAIERVSARAHTDDPADVFGAIGEAIHWISALAALTFPEPEDLPALLSGMVWARNKVTHGAVIWELVRVAGPRALVGPRGGQVGLGGGQVGPGGQRWIHADLVAAEPDRVKRKRGRQKAQQRGRRIDYQEHVQGHEVGPVLRQALALARDGAEPGE